MRKIQEENGTWNTSFILQRKLKFEIEDVDAWGDPNYTHVSYSVDRKKSFTVINLNVTLLMSLNSLKVINRSQHKHLFQELLWNNPSEKFF